MVGSNQSYMYIHVVHPESFRSNAQNAIALVRRNRREFACVYLRLRSSAYTYVRAIARTSTPFKVHQIKLHVHG